MNQEIKEIRTEHNNTYKSTLNRVILAKISGRYDKKDNEMENQTKGKA